MYRRFLNNDDYLGIITPEALAQLTRGNDARFIQAEESAEMSIVEYLSENYEIEKELAKGKYIDEYDRRITYPVGVHVYFEGQIHEVIRSVSGYRKPATAIYWEECSDIHVDAGQVVNYSQFNTYYPGDKVNYNGVVYICLAENGYKFDDIRIPMVGGWIETEVTVWQPVEPLGLSLVLREEMSGDKWAPLIPAFFIDGLISRKGNVMVKASVSRNYRFPTLNDLYFLPGGNPDLKNEHGFSYDAGVSFDVGKKGVYKLGGSASWFDSYIDDWIIWLPTTKGFFSPRNVKKVHAYGVEVKANLAVQPAKDWLIDLNGSYSWTPSINEGEKMSPADQSVGKQLPYVPEHSASLTGRLSWRTWAFLYKWAYYSERFTMSSNDYTLTGHLPRYFMSNISLEKMLSFKPLDVQLKLAVNNLFNEDYLSVLSRPMPGINFEFFIGITPKFGKSRK